MFIFYNMKGVPYVILAASYLFDSGKIDKRAKILPI